MGINSPSSSYNEVQIRTLEASTLSVILNSSGKCDNENYLASLSFGIFSSLSKLNIVLLCQR